MTVGRALTFGLLMLLPAALWASLNCARNDVLYASRTLIGQVRKARERLAQAPESVEARERYAMAQARFYARYRYPEGNPEDQASRFEEYFRTLATCEAETAHYGGELPRKTEDGREHPHRQVLLLGKNRDGERVTVALEWIRYRGTWYIDDCAAR
jgi:hypothetical protein